MQNKRRTDRRQRVLVIDDDPLIHKLVRGLLATEDIELISALSGHEALPIAQEQRPDLILLDYEMPDENGLEILQQIHSRPALASTPVIFATGNASLSILTASFKGGAVDYIRKPFCAPEIRARVRSVLDRKQMQDQLQRLAMNDALTGLPNRTSIRDLIQSAIDREQGDHAAVLFLDFDRFKLVNDSLGHDVGDELLKQIAERLRKSLRGGDGLAYCNDQNSAARLGGDEFVVLLEDLVDPQDALLVTDRMLATLAAPYCLAGHQVCSTASIGVVNSLSSYTTSDEVLRDADTAMYAAKSAGKECYVLYDQSMHDEAQRRLKLESDLRQALTDDQLFLEYQPIVSLITGRPAGLEALVRWQHPERGVIRPDEFLPMAVETGLIVNIGTFALDRACRDLAAWQRSPETAVPIQMHVNLSQKQLAGDLVDTVMATLEKYAIAPECLHLEVTESEIMEAPIVARETLSKLRRLGVNIDMDDFGTGHSSLSCLQELPIDVIKIDRSFVSNMERNHSFAALVHAVTSLAENLQMVTVAEGIETPDQLAMLQTMGCQFGQGFMFAEPLPQEQVAAYLQQSVCGGPGAMFAGELPQLADDSREPEVVYGQETIS